MTALLVYGLKNCDTCKKALKALAATGREVAFVDIRAEADLAAKVPVWLSAVGGDALVNKRSTTWRGLSGEQQGAADGNGAIELLIGNPTLIKRPVIEADGTVYVGWGKDVSRVLG